jgi:hypothetical protein
MYHENTHLHFSKGRMVFPIISIRLLRKTAVIGILVQVLVSQGFGQFNLTRYNPLPALNCITRTNTQYVVVGDSGCILTSPDMETWFKRMSPTDRNLRSVTWTGALAVAVGDSGTIITSSDAITWSGVDIGKIGDLNSVFWTGDGLIAAGDKGVVLTSIDASQWTAVAVGTTKDLYAITRANGLFVAVGGLPYNSGSGVIFTSTDGAHWTNRSSDTISTCPYFRSVACLQDRFVAVGENHIVTSNDGITWKNAAFSRGSRTLYFVSVIADSNRFVAVIADGGFWYSSSGLSWTELSLQSVNFTMDLRCVARIDGQYTAMGTAGSIVSTSGASGGVWKNKSSGFNDNIFSLGCNGKLLVAAGYVNDVHNYGVIHVSPDGVNWTNWKAPDPLEMTAVVWTGSQFVVVGGSGTRGVAYASADGSAWSKVYSSSDEIYDAAWSGNRIVAVGRRGSLLTSPDGSNWTIGTSCAVDDLNSIIWTGDRFVAIGCSDTTLSVVTSSDGQNWNCNNIQTKNPGDALFSLVWTGTGFAALGRDGVVFTSPDAQTWTGRSSGTFKQLQSLEWTGKELVAVGNRGVIVTSPDGISWKNMVCDTTKNLCAVKWTGSRLVISGYGGTFFMSPEETGALAFCPAAIKASSDVAVRSVNGSLIKVTLCAQWNSKKLSLGLFNLQGKCLLRFSSAGQASSILLNVNKVASGPYFLQVEADGKKVMRPVMLKK